MIHRIWLGGEPMPDVYTHFGETWQRHHPAWELRLWTDTELPPLTHPEAYARCRNHGERSDVLRYELLHRFGGIYADTDVECQRSLEPLIGNASAFAAWARPGTLGSAVVGAVPGHPAIARLLEEVSTSAGSGNQVVTTGPGLLTRVFEEAPDVTIFPSETFYPFDHSDLPLESKDFPDAYAIHHWEGTWKDRDLLQRRKRQLRKRVKRVERRERQARREAEELGAELDRTRARLEAIERTAWWRARAGAGALARRARALGRRR